MDVEERRERQRAYSRAYRVRVRDRAAVSLADAETAAETPGVMAEAVDRAVAAMKWLVDSDAALVELARLAARQVDALRAAGTPTATMNALRYQAQLQRCLQELGGTPRIRMQLELRSRRLHPEVDVVTGGNVSKFERPAKRKSQRD